MTGRTLLLAAVSAAAAVCALAQPVLPPWPLEGTVAYAQALAAATPLTKPSGLARADYLTTINGVVRFWTTYQNASGHIIDPFRGVETQYATPCYAFACATVATAGSAADLLPNCTAALVAATTELATHSCADGHCVFFMKPVMLAYRILAPLVTPAVKAVLDANLQAMSPTQDFGFPTNNWGLVGCLDMLRTTYITQFGNSSWWNDMLTFQVRACGTGDVWRVTCDGGKGAGEGAQAGTGTGAGANARRPRRSAAGQRRARE